MTPGSQTRRLRCRPSASRAVFAMLAATSVAAAFGLDAPRAAAADRLDREMIAAAATMHLQPRTPLDKGREAPLRPLFWETRLILKFNDEVRARPSADPLRPVVSLSGFDLREIHQTALDHDLTFEPLIQAPAATTDWLEARAAVASGIAQPDLAGMMIVHFNLEGATNDTIQRVAARLHASDLVEWVYFQELLPPPPSCEDALPVTPQYFPNSQGYHGPDPGLNMQAAWSLGNARGAGITLADCEYGFVTGHEDLCNIISEPGQTVHPSVELYGWDEHGTAVFGEIVGMDNGYGVTGLAPEADALFFPEWTVEQSFRRTTAITNAIAAVDAGDVVLLEMQAGGPDGRYCPAEIDPSIWTVVKNGTDAGVIVVGAAGNGAADLDSSAYASYRSRGDSGAIIVGAGSASTQHNRLSFSTFGSRVNVHGWGESVFTLGYGDFAQHGGDKNQRYTSRFSGTSSASPFVAGSCLALQSLAVEHLGRRLLPLEMRDLLIRTGVPQGSGGHIGPFPDVFAAAQDLLSGSGDLQLSVPTLQAGEVATLSAANATPDARVAFVYSVSGLGSTYVPQLDVTLDLNRPSLAGTNVANSQGEAQISTFVPNAAANRSVWLQAAEYQRKSTVVETVVQP